MSGPGLAVADRFAVDRHHRNRAAGGRGQEGLARRQRLGERETALDDRDLRLRRRFQNDAAGDARQNGMAEVARDDGALARPRSRPWSSRLR